MKVEIINKDVNKLEVQVFKEGHTLCAPIKELIFENKDKIDMAGYKIKHPLKPDPTIYIKTTGNVKPEDILISSTKRLLEIIKEFEDSFNAALKQFK
ncbi:MAG: RpoL/Rpb11 RNA polymerase subunit family protein [Candidatus Helarchaeota archaeon]